MAYQLIQEESLENIGNVIRAKTGSTAKMSPAQMAAAIASISSSGGSSTNPANFISEQAHIDTTTQGAFVTLLSGNSFVAQHYNASNLFVIITPDNLDSIDTSQYQGYQWTCMFSGNENRSGTEDDIWYGMGIYLMMGKGYSYPSTLEIPYSLNDTSSSNYSYINCTSNGDVRVYICSYDAIASGDYTVSVGLL